MGLKKSGMEEQRLLIWIRIGTSGGICMVMNFGFHKMWEIS
jgi:hypothetical protein